MANFNRSVPILLEFEGGYVDNPSDPGGATRYGITERTARAAGYVGDMKAFPIELAKEIYKEQYWDVFNLDGEPSNKFALLVFDTAVNCGVNRTRGWISTIPTGVDKTRYLIAQRANHYSKISLDNPKFLTFIVGWLSRIVECNKRGSVLK